MNSIVCRQPATIGRLSGARRQALGVVAACLLSACVSTPLPDLQVDLPEHWQQAPAADARVTLATEGRSWWRALGDRQLDALVEQALRTNLDIGQAQARLRAARVLHAHADAPLRPNLHARTSDPVDPDASASFLLAGFDSTWELGLFGRGTAIHRLARADLDTAQADLDAAHVSVAAEIARTWIELRAAQQRETVLSGIRDARLAQAERIESRKQLGLASAQQAAQARAATAQAGAALAEPRAAAQASAQALAVLLGRAEPDPGWLAAGPLPQLHDWRVTAMPADLLRARPDIAREQAAVLRAAGELGIAKADRYPSIAIGGSILWSASEIENRNTRPNRIAAFGPIIDIPLFDWGMRRAQAAAKGELLQAAALDYRKTVLNAAAEVETALGALQQQRLREQAGVQAWQALADVAERTRERQHLGLASGLDIAAADAERDEAQLQVLDARSNSALDYVALCKALGGNIDAATHDDANGVR